MLDSSNPETFPAISELCEIAANPKRLLLLWVGAGVSRWAGLPSWADLAERLHREFSRKEPTYERLSAVAALEKQQFPVVFDLCKRCSNQRYNRLILDALTAATVMPVYDRFISSVSKFNPIAIITTNPDELLEQRITAHVVLPTDFETMPQLLAERKPFIAKLHGSVSQIESLVFTETEYDRLLENKSLINALTRVFEISTVVFCGYGLRDEYVLKTLSSVSDLAQLFGTGPHFACRSNTELPLPASVRTIKYTAESHRDHRSVIQVIEEVAIHSAKTPTAHGIAPNVAEAKEGSLHMLSDVFPVGTWITSQRVTAKPPDGDEFVFHVGHGLTLSEMPLTESTAMHDFAVGLVCFDRVLAPLSALGRIHAMLGAAKFEQLVRADVLRFARLRSTELVRFPPNQPELVGSLATAVLPERADHSGRELPVRELLMRQILATPGKEAEANQIFDLLERQLLDPMPFDTIPVPRLVQSLLLRPSVREMLGMSGGVPVTAVPRWLMFPILRLAQVIRLGLVCESLCVDSIKFELGNDRLAGAAFSTSFGNEFASKLASYVVAGSFSTDLGAFINQNPAIIDTILRFRDTSAGQNLRREISDNLAKSAGAEVVTSINAGLRQVVPLNVLEGARANFARLSIAEERTDYPAIWYDADNGAQALRLWRQKSAYDFEQICREQRLGPYDRCPCGSGEKVRFCCGESLTKNLEKP